MEIKIIQINRIYLHIVFQSACSIVLIRHKSSGVIRLGLRSCPQSKPDASGYIVQATNLILYAGSKRLVGIFCWTWHDVTELEVILSHFTWYSLGVILFYLVMAGHVGHVGALPDPFLCCCMLFCLWIFFL